MKAEPPHIHPIEVESYSIMESRVDFTSWSEPARSVVARMVHATADESFASSALVGSRAVQRAIEAIRSSAPVVCDSRMVVAGMPGLGDVAPVVCALDLIDGAKSASKELPAGGQLFGVPGPGVGNEMARRHERAVGHLGSQPAASGGTRSAAAIREAAHVHPQGALWVIGNAPSALAMLLDLHEAGLLTPAAVVGVPVGYVGAAHAKKRLWESSLAEVSITNSGERGGSPVAAAAVNAIVRLAESREHLRQVFR